MRTFYEIKNILTEHKEELKQKYNIREIGIFGSYVRGEQKETSEGDILADFETAVGFFKFLECEEYIESIIGTKVDLISKKALRPKIGEYILKEIIFV